MSRLSHRALGASAVSFAAAILVSATLASSALATPPPGWTAHPPLHIRRGPSPTPNATPPGLSPAQVRGAYGITGNGAGQTIAIVDAYHCPTAESDLKVFSQQFSLPVLNTSGHGKFQQVYPNGKPRTDSGWALEISLDVQWAHAIAPEANIMLVEAKSNSFTNLMAAVDYATSHNASVVSCSWGGSEFSSESSYDYHFNVPGVTFLVSSGDNGTPAEYPSASPYVVSVGGTSLTINGTSYVSEKGWSGSGGGTSAYEAAPSYQSGLKLARRSTPDVSLVADPNTGVAVYDTTGYQGQKGWFVLGGTSASAPMWGGIFANVNAGRQSPLNGANIALYSIYNSASYTTDFHDITSGNNGVAATSLYDQVTGIGTAIGGKLIPDLIAK